MMYLKAFAQSVQSDVKSIGNVTMIDRETLREKWESCGFDEAEQYPANEDRPEPPPQINVTFELSWSAFITVLMRRMTKGWLGIDETGQGAQNEGRVVGEEAVAHVWQKSKWSGVYTDS